MPQVSSSLGRQKVPHPTGRRRACDTCFQRKIKCDSEFPQCNWCKHHNLACTYNRITGRIKSRNQIDLSSIRNVAHESSASKTHFSNDGIAGALKSSTEAHRSPRSTTPHKDLTFVSGIHLFSDEGFDSIERQVGEKVNRENLSALELPWTNPRRIQDDGIISNISSAEMPRRDVVDIYVQRYTSAFQTLVFPVVSKSLFSRTLDLAYGACDVFGHASAKACVYSFLSLVSLFGLDINAHGIVDCWSYVLETQGLVPRIIQEMTADGLQSLMMLVQLQYLLGDLQSASVSISVATRLIYKLGAHRTSANLDSSVGMYSYNKCISECHLRDLFWLCYSFDKDICLRIGQPPSINDSDCDLSLPLNYGQLQNINIHRDDLTPDDQTLPLFPWDIRLSMIKSETYNTLYSTRASSKSDSEVLESIRHLDDVLEQWRLTLDSHIRPMLCYAPDIPIVTNLNTQGVILRLSYYHCICMIHQASERNNILEFGPGVDSEGISSSVRISTTASRSTLGLLQTTLSSLKGECFWVVLFYIITATQCLFCNILKSPSEFESSNDVDILHGVPVLLNRIPIRNLTPAEIIHLNFLSGFTGELARLGTCAIVKSQRELGGSSSDTHLFNQ